MDLCYVTTSSGRIFYTSMSLNDRFKQYQVLSPIGCRQDYLGYQVFSPSGYGQDYRECRVFGPTGYGQDYGGYFKHTRARKRRPGYEIYQSRNMFEKGPVVWDSNIYEHSSVWTFFRDSPSSDQNEPIIYRPVRNTKKKKRKKKARESNAGSDQKEPEVYKPPVINMKKKKRKKRAKSAQSKALVTKEQLDNELDEYMMNVQ